MFYNFIEKIKSIKEVFMSEKQRLLSLLNEVDDYQIKVILTFVKAMMGEQ